MLLTAVPSISRAQVDVALDHYLILASDGVWEFLSPDQAVEIVHCAREQGMSPTDACRQLIGRSALEWRKHEGDYRDDITATVLWLGDVVQSLSVLGDAASS